MLAKNKKIKLHVQVSFSLSLSPSPSVCLSVLSPIWLVDGARKN